jgi:radical SAM additional 4Fe4S-binding domain
MKASMFNVFSEQKDGNVFIFNSLTGALAKMDRECFNIFKELMDRGPDINPNTKSNMNPNASTAHDLAVQLKQGGFIVEDSFGELGYVKKQYDNTKYRYPSFNLEIVPTNNCNFACKYCYYAGRNNMRMTEDVEDALMEFLRQRIGNRKILNVVWTGGEPTMAPESVVRLSGKLLKLAVSLGIEYKAAIFSNGYLLDGDMAHKFRSCGIELAQVVLDGSREVHDQRRPLVGNTGTFDTVLRNLKDISAVMNVLLRVNLDSTNANAGNISQMLDNIEQAGIPKSVTIELAQVLPYTSGCNEFVRMNGFNRKVYAEKLSELLPLVQERGYGFLLDLKPHFGASCCKSSSSFAVSPDGDVYRCFLIMGDKRECVGNLLNPPSLDFQKGNYTKWDEWSPFNRKECTGCSIFPICMGGDACPFPDVTADGYIRDDIRCSPLKFNIEKMLELKVRQRRQNHAV